MSKRFSIEYLIGSEKHQPTSVVVDQFSSYHSSDSRPEVSELNERKDSLKHLREKSLKTKTFAAEEILSENLKKEVDDALKGTTSNPYLSQLSKPVILDGYHVGLQNVAVRLEGASLWNKFYSFGTEMIVTKTGRRMFPTLQVSLSGMDPTLKYSLMVDLTCIDNKRYRYAFHLSKWTVAGPDKAHIAWESLNVRILQIIVNSMHRYQPNLHVVVHDDGPGLTCRTFTFPNTAFMAVTAYQNHRITELKIESNPFAKGFRECEMADTIPMLLNPFFPFYTTYFSSQFSASNSFT